MKTENIEDIYTLSSTQQGMLFHILIEPESGMYLEQTLCTLEGKLNVSAFEKAWQQIIERHPSLRTGFVYKNLEKPVQVVYRRVKLVIEQDDWRKLPITEQDKQLNAFVEADRKRGFQISEPPLMRLTLIHIDEEIYQLIWSAYHLILDGWCIDILLKEFFTLYEAFRQGHNFQLQPCYPYRNYITWLKQQDVSAAEVFWRQTLSRFKTPSLIGSNCNNDSTKERSYDQQQIQLSASTTAALKSLAKQNHLTLNTLFIGAWALLLSHYSKKKDVLFGTVMSGRPVTLPGVESMVGLFVNTLPTRVQITSQDVLVTWLKNLQSQYNQLRQYECTPLVKIQNWSEVSGELPLFESLLACQNSLVDISQLQTEDLKINNVSLFSRSNYPLNFVLLLGSELGIVSYYDLRFFTNKSITIILNQFQAVFAAMTANQNTCIADLLNLIDEIESKSKAVELELIKKSNMNKLKTIQPRAIKICNET